MLPPIHRIFMNESSTNHVTAACDIGIQIPGVVLSSVKWFFKMQKNSWYSSEQNKNDLSLIYWIVALMEKPGSVKTDFVYIKQV